MPTPFANEQLSAYLDAELSDAERSDLEAALQADPELRAELEALESAVSFLRRHGPVSAPEGFQQRVLAAVADEPMPGGWWRWLRRPFGIPLEGLAVAAVAALVLLVALPVTFVAGNRASQSLGEPFAYDKGADLAPAGKPTAAAPPAETAKEKAAKDTGSAVADVDLPPPPPARSSSTTHAPVSAGSGGGSAVVGTTDPSDDARAQNSVGQWAVTEQGAASTGDDGTAEGAATQPAAPAAEAKKSSRPTLGGAAYRYEILTYDEGALSALQRIATAYKGQVTDSRGQAVRASDLRGQGTYYVRLPATRLAEFGDALRDLGAVTEVPNDAVFAEDIISVQVQITLMPVQAYDAQEAAPARDVE